MCRRLHAVVHDPQLIAAVQLECSHPSQVEPRLLSLAAWLNGGAARHVRWLSLSICATRHTDVVDVAVMRMVEIDAVGAPSALAACLQACAAAGTLQEVHLHGARFQNLPATLAGLTSLQRARLEMRGNLQLGDSLLPLSRLEELRLPRSSLDAEPALPPSLTLLHCKCGARLPQVGSDRCLVACRRCWQAGGSRPEIAPAGVDCVRALFLSGKHFTSGSANAALLRAALPRLRQLTYLTLGNVQGLPTPPAELADLPSLRCLCWESGCRSDEEVTPLLPAGPWLTGLTHLGMQRSALLPNLPLLAAAATRLEILTVIEPCRLLAPDGLSETLKWAEQQPALHTLELSYESSCKASQDRGSSLVLCGSGIAFRCLSGLLALLRSGLKDTTPSFAPQVRGAQRRGGRLQRG